jgi:SAM-dependent methyltransferase
MLSRINATQYGVHEGGVNIKERYVPGKVKEYHKILNQMFPDVWKSKRDISWIDIGAGYGEMIQAIRSLSTQNSRIVGIEPMKEKIDFALKNGIEIIEGFISEDTPICDFASAINIFSHIYNFDDFLQDVRKILKDNGEFLLITGDMTDINNRIEFPGEFGLPDHVAFDSEKHLKGFLERNGFEIISIKKIRIDGLIYTIKNIVKKLLGRNTVLALPYSSCYRDIYIRAKKK